MVLAVVSRRGEPKMYGTRKSLLISALAGAMAMGFSVDVEAQRSGRSARQNRTQTRSTTRTRVRQQPRQAQNQLPQRQKTQSRKAEVKEAKSELHREAHNGYAAAMYVIPHAHIKESVVQHQGEYGSGKMMKVKVSGLGSSGQYNADFLGSVSTHNEGGRFVGDPQGMASFIKNRVAGDGVKIIHISPKGVRTEIVANHPSDIVTHLQLSVKLEKGKNVIRYERTNRSTGQIVSARGLYPEWREKHIEWDGN